MSGAQGGWSAWPAPAKLNLFLRITGRRPNGYHALQTVFRLLDWGDRVWIRIRQDGVIGQSNETAVGAGGFDAEGDGMPSIRYGVDESEDLSIRAAKLLQSVGNVSQGADIFVEKCIPVGGGFGGGSSDAATSLMVLNRLWKLNWSLDRLAKLGLQLGADVPLFVHGQNAWGEGVGEKLTPIDLRPAWYVLADPGVHASTAELFQAPELTRDSSPATMSDFVSAAVEQRELLGNAFEPVLRGLEPAVEAAFLALSLIGRPRLTGSGSGCFVEFGDRASALAGLAALPRGLRAWIAVGASRSPLHVALETTS